MLNLTLAGAARTVTGSMHYFEYFQEGKKPFRFCVDAGMFQVGYDVNLFKINSHLLFEPTKLDAVVVSHGHADHIGRLPYLVKMGFSGKIYANEATKKITEIVLTDAATHQVEAAKKAYYFFQQKGMTEVELSGGGDKKLPKEVTDSTQVTPTTASPLLEENPNAKQYGGILNQVQDESVVVQYDSGEVKNKSFQKLKKRHPFLENLEDKDKRIENSFEKYKEENTLFEQVDVETTMRRFETHEYHRPFKIHENLEVVYYDAGHILGSTFLIIKEISSGRQIAFSGDLGNPGKPIIQDPETPPKLKNVTHILCETTYGNRLHPELKPKERLRKLVYKTLKREGKVFIPSFSVERAQEVIYFLVELMEENKIPKVPIYLDSPMASKMLDVCLQHPELYDKEMQSKILNKANPLMSKHLKVLETTEQSKSLNGLKDPCIIIAGSGMMTGGRIVKHFRQNASESKNTFLFVGFQADGTLGRKIADGEKKIEVETQIVEVNCEIDNINEFSGHADQLGLKNWIMGLISENKNNQKTNLILVHGEEKSMEAFKKEIEFSLGNKVETKIPFYSEKLEIWKD